MRVKNSGFLGALSLALIAMTFCPVRAETILHDTTSHYHTIIVSENNGLRCLRFARTHSGVVHTCMMPYFPDELQFPNVKAMLGALYVQPDPKQVLMIGLGGGTLPTTLAKLYPEAVIDSVDIDPAVIKVAEKYFNFRIGEKQRAYAEDGRVFVKRALQEGRRYDLILLDAFSAPVIPEHMTTQEFLTEVKGILAPHGAYAVNTVPREVMYDHESVTYEAVFGRFLNLRVGGNRVIIVAADGVPSSATLQANAERLDDRLRRFGLDYSWWAPLVGMERDWNTKAQVLTDQFSPSNLLNATPAHERP
ncbi:MAG: fused MFS/spermidine synthase [Alphaproteobacteria bacterium]